MIYNVNELYFMYILFNTHAILFHGFYRIYLTKKLNSFSWNIWTQGCKILRENMDISKIISYVEKDILIEVQWNKNTDQSTYRSPIVVTLFIVQNLFEQWYSECIWSRRSKIKFLVQMTGDMTSRLKSALEPVVILV